MPQRIDPRSDADWLDLFREGGPKRTPKEPDLPRAGSAHRPKPWEEAAFRAWTAQGRPTAGAGVAGGPASGTGGGATASGGATPGGGTTAGGAGHRITVDGSYFHIAFKVHSRGGGKAARGRSAAGEPSGGLLARIAYRTAERLVEPRTPETHAPETHVPGAPAHPGAAHVAYTTGSAVDVHDYSRKQGVAEWYTLIPEGAPAWMADPARLGDLWAAVAAAETRLNTRPNEATEAREAVLSLPHELDAETRSALAHDFAQLMVRRYGVVATVAVHAPSRSGDARNHHAHIMVSDRRWTEPEGFYEKARELNLHAGGSRTEVPYLRAAWASMVNEAYTRAGYVIGVDHRSFETRKQEALARGDAVEAARWDREATEHMGPSRTAAERAAARAARARGEDAPEPVTDMGRENAAKRAASEARERDYRRTRARERARERDRALDRELGHGLDDDFGFEPDR